MTQFEPNKYEIEALYIINGDLPMKGGAAFNASVEFLQEAGFVTRGLNWNITEKGRKYLNEHSWNGSVNL